MSDALVIIPTYNEKENIEAIIRTVFNQKKTFHILVVDDKPANLRLLAKMLTQQGYTIRLARDGQMGLSSVRSLPPDLILLDVVLEDDSDGGFTICRKLLDRGNNFPIVFLSDRSDEIDQVFGLRLGAWDYQTKPISLALLVERVKAVLRTHKARQDISYPIANSKQTLAMDYETSYVAWKERTVPLTLTEFRMFAAIVDAGAQGIDYQALSESTMQRMVTNGTISSHVKNIRKKFVDIDADFSCILNKPGFGYRWEAP